MANLPLKELCQRTFHDIIAVFPDFTAIKSAYSSNNRIDAHDIDACVLIELIEVILGSYLPAWSTSEMNLRSYESPVQNLQDLMDYISGDILDMDLSHITAQGLSSGNPIDLFEFLSILKGLALVVFDSKQKINDETLNDAPLFFLKTMGRESDGQPLSIQNNSISRSYDSKHRQTTAGQSQSRNRGKSTLNQQQTQTKMLPHQNLQRNGGSLFCSSKGTNQDTTVNGAANNKSIERRYRKNNPSQTTKFYKPRNPTTGKTKNYDGIVNTADFATPSISSDPSSGIFSRSSSMSSLLSMTSKGDGRRLVDSKLTRPTSSVLYSPQTQRFRKYNKGGALRLNSTKSESDLLSDTVSSVGSIASSAGTRRNGSENSVEQRFSNRLRRQSGGSLGNSTKVDSNLDKFNVPLNDEISLIAQQLLEEERTKINNIELNLLQKQLADRRFLERTISAQLRKNAHLENMRLRLRSKSLEHQQKRSMIKRANAIQDAQLKKVSTQFRQQSENFDVLQEAWKQTVALQRQAVRDAEKELKESSESRMKRCENVYKSMENRYSDQKEAKNHNLENMLHKYTKYVQAKHDKELESTFGSTSSILESLDRFSIDDYFD